MAGFRNIRATAEKSQVEQKFGRAGEVYKSAKDGRKLGGLRCRNVEDKRFEININTIRQSKKVFCCITETGGV